MNVNRQDDTHSEQSERIEDLASRTEDVHDAEQVRGGFDPQPDPPKVAMPKINPPIYNPGASIRL